MVHFHSFLAQGFGVMDFTVAQGAFGVKTTQASNILGSAAELDADGERFIGNASIEILNIAPRSNGTLHIRINVVHSSPLNVLVALVYFPNPNANEE